MFYDLLTRNSNEYFCQGPTAGRKKGERAKHIKEEEDEKEFLNLFANQQNQNFATQEGKSAERQKLERAANKMAVNKKQQQLMMASQDERQESKDKKKTTPSLEQEMNLARRACWCNNNLNFITTKKGQVEEDKVEENAEEKLKQQCCDNCFKRLNEDNNMKKNDIEKDKDKEMNENEENEEEDVNETTVLNGAKNFSKNIKLNKTTTTTTTTNYNANNSNSNNCNDNDNVNNNNVNSNSKIFSNTKETKTTTTTNSLSKRKNILNKHKLEADKTSISSSTISKDDKDDAANNSTPLTHVNNTLTPNNQPNKIHENTMMARLRVLFLQMWLAFVEFCDKNTIKPNDPRFAPYRTPEELEKQKKQQQQQQQQQNRSANNKSKENTSTSNAKKPFQFKLLTNKKLIFLFVICVFFSCVNRIEARPNLESSNNAIAADAVAPALAAGNAGGSTVKSMDNSVSGKSNVSRQYFIF